MTWQGDEAAGPDDDATGAEGVEGLDDAEDMAGTADTAGVKGAAQGHGKID
jgi:hypothetical protein